MKRFKRLISPKLIGLLLLVFLLTRFDIDGVLQSIQGANGLIIVVAVLLNLPMILLKTLRWQTIMSAQKIHYRLIPANLAYWGSIFVGFLTPGRLGEFVKALHVKQDCNVSIGTALSSVLIDRLLDLYLLSAVGGLALISVSNGSNIIVPIVILSLLTIPLIIFLNDSLFHYLQHFGNNLGTWGKKLFNENSWLLAMRTSFKQLKLMNILIAVLYTIGAYAFFFAQCYLLALALGVEISFTSTSYAVALGSLITLVPVSISGLGTRDVAILAYLETEGIAAASALSFSILIFAVFYLGGSLIGAVAWWLKPVNLEQLRGRHTATSITPNPIRMKSSPIHK